MLFIQACWDVEGGRCIQAILTGMRGIVTDWLTLAMCQLLFCFTFRISLILAKALWVLSSPVYRCENQASEWRRVTGLVSGKTTWLQDPHIFSPIGLANCNDPLFDAENKP